MRNNIIIDDEKSIYDQGLSVQLFACRTDRFNEWQMDEFADKAADMEKEIATLKAERDDWREQAQRNDTPVKSAAEIGRDAILEVCRDADSLPKIGVGAYERGVSDCIQFIEKSANNLPNNTGA